MADHIVYRCLSQRFTDGYENVTAGGVVETSDTAISIPGADTSGSTRVIAVCVANSIDGQTTLQAGSSWPSDDPDVTGESSWSFCQTATGVGGGTAHGTGVLASAGSSGTFTNTWNTATDRQAYVSWAMYGSGTPALYDSTTGSGTDDVTVSLPIAGGGFYYFLIVQTANEEVEISSGTGWTKIAEVGTGTAGAAGSTRITVFAADKDSSPTAPTLSIVEAVADVSVASFTQHAPAIPVRRKAMAALAVASMVAPLLPPDPPELSWAPRYVDAARRVPTALNVGGYVGPAEVIPDPGAPDLWLPSFPDSAPGHRPRLHVGAVAPELPYQDATELSWSPRYADRLDRTVVRDPGWIAFPSIDTSTPDTGSLEWGAFYPSLAPGPRRNPFGCHVLPLSFAGQALTLGSSTCEQKIFGASPETGTWTTYSTDVSITTVANATDLFTAVAHGMKTGDGPYRFSTTGTLPSGLSSTTDYFVDREDADTFKVSTTAANALAGTNVAISDDGSGTLTLVRSIDTAPLGSAIVCYAARGYWNLDGSAPTDNKGNTFTAAAGSPKYYASYPNSAAWVGVKLGAAGGSDHTYSLSYVNYDEPTVGGVEVYGATILQDASHVERTGAATITSASVTATANAVLLAFVFGSGPVGQDHTWTFLDGFTKIPSASDEGNISVNGYIQVSVAYRIVGPGTYTFRAQGISNEGGQMFLLALQAEASSVPAFDWWRQTSEPVRRIVRRPFGGSVHQLLTSYADDASTSMAWQRIAPDIISRAMARVDRGGTVAPLAESYADPLKWQGNQHPPTLRKLDAWRYVVGSTSTPRDTDPGEVPSWSPSYPERTLRGRPVASSQSVAPLLEPAPPELAWSPVYPETARGRRPINVGPSVAQAPADYGPSPDLAWQPEFIDVIRRTPRPVNVGGQSPGPIDPIPNAPAPELAWSPTFPAWFPGRRWRPVVDPTAGWLAAVITRTYIPGRLVVGVADGQWSLDTDPDGSDWDVAVIDGGWSVEVD